MDRVVERQALDLLVGVERQAREAEVEVGAGDGPQRVGGGALAVARLDPGLVAVRVAL